MKTNMAYKNKHFRCPRCMAKVRGLATHFSEIKNTYGHCNAYLGRAKRPTLGAIAWEVGRKLGLINN